MSFSACDVTVALKSIDASDQLVGRELALSIGKEDISCGESESSGIARVMSVKSGSNHVRIDVIITWRIGGGVGDPATLAGGGLAGSWGPSVHIPPLVGLLGRGPLNLDNASAAACSASTRLGIGVGNLGEGAPSRSGHWLLNIRGMLVVEQGIRLRVLRW